MSGGESESKSKSKSKNHAVRWRRAVATTPRNRFRVIAASSCIFATLLGLLISVSTLGSARPNTVLVSLYLLPPAEETLGVCAPFHPLTNRLFDLTPLNIQLIPESIPGPTAGVASVDSNATTEPEPIPVAEPNQPNSVSYRITDWQRAVANCDKRDELVLHVSSLARIEHDQVVFYGRSEDQPSQIAFKDLLATVGQSKAKKTLIVLEVYWPLVSDNGDSHWRIQQLDQSIRSEFATSAPRGCLLLLPIAGTDASAGMPHEPQSMLCKALASAFESPTCDVDFDGRTSIHEIVRWTSLAAKRETPSQYPLPQLTLVGETFDFDIFKKHKNRLSVTRTYPLRLAESWQLRHHYLQATELPFLSATASRWGSGLNDLESRWRRGEPNRNIDAEAERLESTCIGDVSVALQQRRNRRSDSLSIASNRFPFDASEAADRHAVELLNRYDEVLSSIDVGGQAAATKTLVAEYIAQFQPSDTTMALNSLLQTIEQTSSLDAEAWRLICEVRESLPELIHYPIVDALGSMARHRFDSRRFSQQLRLLQLQDRLGTDKQIAAILSKSLARAFETLDNAQRLITTSGMTQPEIIDQSITRAISFAEAVITAEHSIGKSIRRLQWIELILSLDNATGLLCDRDTRHDDFIRFSKRLLDRLQRIRTLSDTNQMPPATELAFLRQECDSIDRLMEQQIESIELAFRGDPLASASVISTLVDPQRRFRLVRGDFVDQGVQRVSYRPTRRQTGNSPDAFESTTTREKRPSVRDQMKRLISDAEQKSHQVPSGSSTIPVRVIGDLRALNWDHPDASFELLLDHAATGESSVRFQFLPPASAAIRIVPDHGVLTVGKAERIHVSLRKSQNGSKPCELSGVWLKAIGETSEALIPISIDTQLSQPSIDIDFGAGAMEKGRHVCIPLWPTNEAQDLRWSLQSIDPTINTVVVSVVSNCGKSLLSQPIELKRDQPTLILFPPPKSDAPNHSSLTRFEDPLTVIVSDNQDGRSLGNWQVTTKMIDPRTMLQPGWAEFVSRDDGTNRISVNVEHTSKVHPRFGGEFVPVVRLELESDASHRQPKSLIDIGNSKLQAIVKYGQSPTTLFAENLRFIEGTPPVLRIPLSINGDRGYFELEGRFPRRSGTVSLSWDQQPQLRIQAADATSPGTALQATIEARNLDDDAELIVEVVGALGDARDRAWQTRLRTSRRIECLFEPSGPNATLCVHAARRDWTLSIPSDFGTGEYRLRAFTVLPAGNASPLAEHRFVIDGNGPTRIQARADVEADQTVIHIVCQPSASGIKSLTLNPVSAAVAEKTKPMLPQQSDATGSRWQLKWPAAIPIPEQINLTFTTGAGKESLMTCDLQVQKIVPVGKLVGRVFEGSIAQPRLTVRLRNDAGVEMATQKTDDQGHFAFSVLPGQYQLATEKVATHRQAATQVSVGQGEVRQVDLSLQRSGKHRFND